MSKFCSVENCWNPTKSLGLCRTHYARQWRNGSTTLINKGDKRSNPLYHLWFERKTFNLLCEEWLDFDTFIKDISPKPEGYYFLVRLKEGLFGPTNFKWQEHLKKREGESNKEWWARKWAARQAANPGMETDRNLKRKFGLNLEQYNQIFKSQNGVCAICGLPETTLDGKTGVVKRLAVDHCHKSLKNRDLLCWRCNTVLGKINEDLELVDKIKTYIMKHKDD